MWKISICNNIMNLDSIDKIKKDCGCVITSKLDIIENEIIESTIIICKTHYLEANNKSQYTYNKSQNIYISNSEISNKIIKNKIKKISSDIDLLNTEEDNNSNILKFGKYKNKTFDYVYNHDKLYCYNLSFWKHNQIKDIDNNDFYKFVNFIKSEIKAF